MSVAAFDRLRPLRFSVAYRMLGQAGAAEDVVQDVRLRFVAAGEDVVDAWPWLLQVTTRLSLDQLRSARASREGYVGIWLPEPVLTGAGLTGPDPLAGLRHRDLLSLGALVLLDRLSPVERAVLVVADGLGLPPDDAGRLVGVSTASSLRLLAGARRRLAGEPALEPVDGDARRELLGSVLVAFESGEAGGLAGRLRDDVVLHGDGGGEFPVARRAVAGRRRVLRVLAGIRAGRPSMTRAGVVAVNGEAALLISGAGGPTAVLGVVTDGGGMVAGLLLVGAPGKLAYLGRQLEGRPTGVSRAGSAGASSWSGERRAPAADP
jgi:DNA-directed RNA polymerase specialized sigma24 family protein